ncbi:MAG: hypothetical protein MI863_06365, partial [Desulfobacterales bacterium]|nr:hypothetical protein [Desulfobacterales bacterium]
GLSSMGVFGEYMGHGNVSLPVPPILAFLRINQILSSIFKEQKWHKRHFTWRYRHKGFDNKHSVI